MPKNPSVTGSRQDCNYHAGLVNQDSLNNPRSHNMESYNTFDKSNIVGETVLFDAVTPFDMIPAIEGDHIRLRLNQDLRTYTLKSPLLTPVKQHQAYFQVPWRAIMPNTWEYLRRTPVVGDDINWNSVAPMLDLLNFFDNLNKIPNTNSFYFPMNTVGEMLKGIYMFWSLASPSGLARRLGLTVVVPRADTIVSDFHQSFVAFLKQATNASVLSVSFTGADGEQYFYTLQKLENFVYFWNFVQDFVRYGVGRLSSNALGTPENPLEFPNINFGSGEGGAEPALVNLMPLIAYQVICATYYTNDKIDDIYSAKMWQQACLALAHQFIAYDGAISDLSFEYNGISVQDDAYSGNIMNRPLANFTDQLRYYLDYMLPLFVIPASLRYGDYFTSSRKQPLGVGDVSASVGGGAIGSLSVSAVDVNTSLWIQRFLNSVNRSKQKIVDYLQSETGVRPAVNPEYQPNFICKETFNLGGLEVENTSENQGNVVTLLKNGESRFMYDVFIDEPSFVIGVETYSMQYMYANVTNKVYYMEDRLDWFNHFMQHVGDQSVEFRELFGIGNVTDKITFAYQLRYAQFKFGISRAVGAFASGDLPSWAAVLTSRFAGQGVYHINSSFIRNRNVEFDQFYASLTAENPTQYFHFIRTVALGCFVNSKQQAYPSLL